MDNDKISNIMYEAHFILVGFIQEQGGNIAKIKGGDSIPRKVHMSGVVDEILEMVSRYYYLGREDLRREHQMGSKEKPANDAIHNKE